MPGRFRRLALCLAVSLALTGCWDRREIEERNTVLAVGADLCENPAPCGMVMTRQVIIPGRAHTGPRSGRSAQAPTVDVIVNDGKDDIDASGKAQSQLHRDMHFGHIRLFVLSEALARKGLKEYMRWVHGLPEQGYLEWVAIAEGKAGDLIQARPRLEELPGLFLYHMLSDSQRAGRIQRVYLSDFQITLGNGGEDAVVPLLRLAGPDRPAMAGLAVFRGATMVGKLSLPEMTTYQQLRGIARGSELIQVTLPGGHPADLRVRKRQARYQVRAEGEAISVQIRLFLETHLTRLSAPLDSSDPAVIEQLERQVAVDIRQRAEALIHKLQHEMGADALAVGQRVRAYHPRAWAAIRDWHEAYPRVSIKVQTEVAVRRMGLANY